METPTNTSWFRKTMKTIISIITVLLFIVSAQAQNRSINFEQTQEWKKIVRKAQKEKKLIFIDCYTSWCGACIIMAQQTFTVDTVADFYNSRFINVKCNVEKDLDGDMIKKKYNVQYFPTLMFIDPENQQSVHTLVGARKASTLIAEGRLALDPENNLSGLIKRYAAGERTPKFMVAYLSALDNAYKQDDVDKIVKTYIPSPTQEQLLTPEGWELIKQYTKDPLSPELQLVVSNRSKFYTIAGKKEVDTKIRKSINAAIRPLVEWTPENSTPFDETRNQALIDYLLQINCEAAPSALAQLYTAAYVRRRDYRGLLEKIKDIRSYSLFFYKETAKSYFLKNINFLAQSNDRAILQEVIQWIDPECNADTDFYYKASLMNCKSRLQTQVGDTTGARLSKIQAETYNLEGKKQQEKRVIRFQPKH